MKVKHILGFIIALGAILCVAFFVISNGGSLFKSDANKDSVVKKEDSVNNKPKNSVGEITPTSTPIITPTPTIEVAKPLIDPAGMTLKSRILTPEGYVRTEEQSTSLSAFLREYPLKEDKAEVLHYDGSSKVNQNAHVAVFKLPLENRNLQQCADSIMRVYAEYYWKQKEYDKIAFHFTNGFLAKYSKWREGYRIRVDGNDVSWVKSASKDNSYESFEKYLRIVFCYAGTMSMEKESTPIDLKDIQVGDVFIRGGSPGHVVMIVDICQNEEGKKAFLLAQGYMPAQEFHVLKNYNHEEDPWYYEDEVTYPFSTPQYTFDEGSLRHLEY